LKGVRSAFCIKINVKEQSEAPKPLAL